jgi:hypothetical protein
VTSPTQGSTTTFVCALCGTTPDTAAAEQGALAALSWVSSRERSKDVHYCPSCSRENLRSIEGKLDAAYW